MGEGNIFLRGIGLAAFDRNIRSILPVSLVIPCIQIEGMLAVDVSRKSKCQEWSQRCGSNRHSLVNRSPIIRRIYGEISISLEAKLGDMLPKAIQVILLGKSRYKFDKLVFINKHGAFCT